MSSDWQPQNSTMEDVLRRAQNAVQSTILACRDTRGVVYIFISDITDPRNVYKIGMTHDVQQRQRDHRTGCPRGIMAFYRYCNQPRAIETKLKETLAQQYHMSGEVVYDVPFDVLKTLLIFLVDGEESNAPSPTTSNEIVNDPPPQTSKEKERGSRLYQCDGDENTENFLYRNLPGGRPRTLGKWNAEEIKQFQKLLEVTEQPIKGGWGLLSRMIPTRVGYQCQSYYRKLVEVQSPLLREFRKSD